MRISLYDILQLEILDDMEGKIMADHDMEVENKEELDANRSLKTRMANKKSPDFSSSTLRRVAFLEYVRLR